jgi:D-cysteine desulfhydrase/L-cysteate sulfo-lyase
LTLTPPITEEELERRISAIPRTRLAHLPTPLEELPRLRRHLGGPRLMVKRDDLTGVAFGGNKVRNLEFRMAEATAAGADTVIMSVDILSNSARQTAAAAIRLGMAPVLVLKGMAPETVTGNLLVDRLLGAEIHHAASSEEQGQVADRVAARCMAEGKTPFILDRSPTFTFSAACAYALATVELLRQLREHGVEERPHLYISSSGKGQAGVELAVRALGLDARVTGSSVKPMQGRGPAEVARLTTEAARGLEIELEVAPGDVDNRDRYVGRGYGIPSPAGDEALRLAAECEGLLLDPVYTAKAFAALVDDVRERRLGDDEVAVFVHTGGLPLIFQHAGHLAGGRG